MLSDYPYYTFDKELPVGLCHGLIKMGEACVPSTGGLFETGSTKYDSAIRNNLVSWINSPDIVTIMYLSIKNANINAGWNFDITGSQTPQFCKYSEGQFYDWHVDTGTELREDSTVRKLTIVISLNENYTGGDLQIERWAVPTETDRFNTVKALHNTGSIAVFPSFMHHRIAPVEAGTRYSLVGWFTGPHFK